MSPLRELRSWTTRYEEEISIDPLQRYYLIFEGANTEKQYFKGVDTYRKELGINNLIEMVILSKEGEIRDYSHPSKLLALIQQKKRELIKSGSYDQEIDQFVIVFDRDSFETKEMYLEFLQLAGEGNILTITSPCFETWLILHYEDAITLYIDPEREKIQKNEKVSKAHSFTSKLFSELSGMNPKTALKFDVLKENVDRAIQAEKQLEQDVHRLGDAIGSNVGQLIEQMRKDPREPLL
ncbi:RloB family protein [Paenibacillus vandeheii]